MSVSAASKLWLGLALALLAGGCASGPEAVPQAEAVAAPAPLGQAADGLDRVVTVNEAALWPELLQIGKSPETATLLANEAVKELLPKLRVDAVVLRPVYASARADITEEVSDSVRGAPYPKASSVSRLQRPARVACVNLPKLLPELRKREPKEEDARKLGIRLVGQVAKDLDIDLVIETQAYWRPRIDITDEVLQAASGKAYKKAEAAARFEKPAVVRFANRARLLAYAKREGWPEDRFWVEAGSVLGGLAGAEGYDIVLQEAVAHAPRIDITSRLIERIQARRKAAQ